MVVSGRQRQQWRATPQRRGVPNRGASPAALVAYDYAAKFELTGRPGNIIQDVINVSAEGIFVATAIGYGLEEDRGRPFQTARDRPQPGQPDGFLLPGDVTLAELPQLGLIEGFRLRQKFDSVLFASDQNAGSLSRNGGRGNRRFADQLTPAAVTVEAFERVKAPEDISFLFSAVDSGTGREMQDEPTHNLASFGKSNGERPFRLLATPLSFLPRSTVRLQIVERSKDVVGTLFVVFYGYKILTPNCPEPVVRALLAQAGGPPAKFGGPPERIVPFDYVATVDLTGQTGNFIEDEVTINAEGGFVVTALGYGLAVEDAGVQLVTPGEVRGTFMDLATPAEGQTITLRNVVTGALASDITDADGRYSISVMPGDWELSRAEPFVSEGRIRVSPGASLTVNLVTPVGPVSPTSNGPVATIDLRNLPLRALPPDALIDGIRIRPDLVRLAFDNGGALSTAFPAGLLDSLFERINTAEDVSFRYSIFDGGRGLELQNRPINNVAGLGIANGDRPFKNLARPMVFLPRSTIRVSVEEHSGRGRLYLAFQGYKILSAVSAGK